MSRIYILPELELYRNGAIIVVLSGVGDINQCQEYYNSVAHLMRPKLRLLALHSKIGRAAMT